MSKNYSTDGIDAKLDQLQNLEEISDKNKWVITEFVQYLGADSNVSCQRQYKYLYTFKSILTSDNKEDEPFIEFDLEEATKDDMRKAVGKIQASSYSEWSKRDMKVSLKKLFRTIHEPILLVQVGNCSCRGFIMSASTHSDASVAYSIPFTNKDYGYDLELPDDVSGYSDLRRKARSKSRSQGIQLANLYSEIKQLLRNYDGAAEQMLEQIEDFEFDLEAEDVRDSLEDMENKNEESKKLIKTDEDLAKSHPAIANDLANHHMLADTFISLAKEIDEKVGFEKILEQDREISKEEYKLNLFLALEPYLVVCVLRADEMQDDEFLNLYQNLFDEMSFRFSRNLPDIFDRIVSYEDLELNEDEFEEFVDNLELEEMYD